MASLSLDGVGSVHQPCQGNIFMRHGNRGISAARRALCDPGLGLQPLWLGPAKCGTLPARSWITYCQGSKKPRSAIVMLRAICIISGSLGCGVVPVILARRFGLSDPMGDDVGRDVGCAHAILLPLEWPGQDCLPARNSVEAATPRHAYEWRAWEYVHSLADVPLINGLIKGT